MKLDFLQRLPFAGGRPTHQVVGAGPAGPARTLAEATLHRLLAELPEVLVAAVVELGAGQPLATYTTTRQPGLDKVCEHNAAVVRQVRLATLRLPGEQLEDILITLSSQLHLLRLLPGHELLLYVALDARDTNLNLARTVMRTSVAT